MTERKSTRKGNTPIIVRVFPDEKRRIEELARSTGNSTAGFLRKVGQGYEVKCALDYERVRDLVKVNRDLERLGGLLKMWLSNDKRLAGFTLQEQRRVVLAALTKIDQNQGKLSEIMKTVVFS
ncbi:conjugal transfer transcriptional regulator TraJ [Variovorax sp. V59]|uniref:conjugal transfer transcriptional regulator TraJ n=1 Tax=unclassified Variovorax TaxID=663243 RepID=UPI0034E8DD19